MRHRDSARTGTCRSISAATVDAAVARLLLTSLTDEQITLAITAAEQVADRHTRAHRAAELALERARYDAARAERAFEQVDPDNRLVARTLEARWEAKLVALTEAETALATARQTRAPLPGRDELLRLAADLPRLWDDPATRAKDRKRLLRTVIADITLLPDEHGQVRIGVRWHTGATDLITTTRRGPDRTPPEALELITRLGPLLDNHQLAAELNAAGLRTGKNRPFDAKAVSWARHAHKVRAPRTQPLNDGEITVKQAAARLGITADAVYYWITNALTPARKTPTGRWAIPWNPQTEAAYRQRVAESVHLKPKTPLIPTGGAV